MKTLPQKILATAATLPQGATFSPKQFLHLGSRVAVDQTFTRLTKAAKLYRVSRGLYVLPVPGFSGMRAPTTETIIDSISAQTGETIVAHGAAVANSLGLTTQVPTREIFLTSGPSRKIKLAARIIEIRHCPGWQVSFGNRLAGECIRALVWAGPTKAASVLKILRTQLPEPEWIALRSCTILPSWMSKIIAEEGMRHAELVHAHGERKIRTPRPRS